MSQKKAEFEDFLDATDYGFIVDGKTGKLKGLWIPDGMEHVEVPETIEDICVNIFGIDPNETDQPLFH